MAERRKGLWWAALAGMLLLYAAFLWFRLGQLKGRGEPVYWLAELWAPTGFLSLVGVILVERIFGEKKAGRTKKRPK